MVDVHPLKHADPPLIETLRDMHGVLHPRPLEDLVVPLTEGNVSFEYRQRGDVLERIRGVDSLELEGDFYFKTGIRPSSKPQRVRGAHFVIGEKVATIQFFEDLESAIDYVKALRAAMDAKASAIEQWRREVKAARVRIQMLRTEIDEINQRRLDALGGSSSDWIIFGKLEKDIEMKKRQLLELEKIANSARPRGPDKSYIIRLEYATGTVLNLGELERLVSKKYWEIINDYRGVLPKKTEIHISGPVYAFVKWKNDSSS